MMILVSVIVPVYNVEKYVSRCLDSLINQTLKEIEIIIVDDGSTDDSAIICREYAKKYQNIVYIHQDNQGLSGARNTGIEKAKGKYIGFVDSDDFVEKDMFEFLYSMAEQFGTGIAACGYVAFYDDGTINECIKPNIRKMFSLDEALDYYLLPGYFEIIACNKIFKRELFPDIRFPIGKVYEDIPTIYKLIDRAGELYFDSTPKYFYYRRDGSLSQSGLNSNVPKLIDIVDEFVNFCITNIKTPRLVYLGQIWWYTFVLNKFLAAGETMDGLVDKMRRMIGLHFNSLFISDVFDLKTKFKFLLIFIMPNIYKKIYPIIYKRKKRK